MRDHDCSPHADDPTHPARLPRRRRALSPDEVLRLARGEEPAAVGDPLRLAIARSGEGLGAWGWRAFDRARRSGLLVVARTPQRSEVERVVRLWGWWCAAARCPEAVLRLDRDGAMADLEVDLSPAGRRFEPSALVAIGRGWSGGGGRWLVSDETLHLTSLPTPAGLALARTLLRVVVEPGSRTEDTEDTDVRFSPNRADLVARWRGTG